MTATLRGLLLPLVFGCAAIAALVMFRAEDPFPVSAIRLLAFDQFQRLSPRPKSGQPIRIVDIDEAALAELGQWPWPRDRLALLVERLAERGAASIAFDIAFAEPDRLSPARLLDNRKMAQLFAASDTAGRTLPDTDQEFASAIATVPVALGFGITQKGGGELPPPKSGYAVTGERTLDGLPQFSTATPVVPVLLGAAAGLGTISLAPGQSTGIVRRLPLMLVHEGKPYPALSLEALRLALGASTYVIQGAPDAAATVTGIRLGDIGIATTALGELWLHYRKNDPDFYIPVLSLLADQPDPALNEKISGHIVLVGTSATGLLDVRTTPLGETVAGVSIHAQALEQILDQDFLWRPDWANGLEVILIVLTGLIIVVTTVFFSPLLSFVLGAGVAAAIAGGSWLAFTRQGLLLDPSYPLFAGLVTQFAVTAYKFLITDRDARFVTRAFSRYVSPEVLSDIRKNPAHLKLGGEVREMTIMFVDIRDFTPLSEGLSPEALVKFLNSLLSELSLCVTEEQGTIDKYIGDSIMAFWNAPVIVDHHESRACRAALAMRGKLAEMNAADAFGFAEAGYSFAHIAIGVGINTGLACVGNLGSAERFDYSVIGDAVNLASRVESACKEVGADVVITGATARMAMEFAMLDAGHVMLKGKSEPQPIHAVAGGPHVATSAEFLRLAELHRDLVAAIKAGKKAEARKRVAQCRNHAEQCLPEMVRFYERLPDRFEDFRLKLR